jgi:uncharacterized protein (TIGR03382 family)
MRNFAFGLAAALASVSVGQAAVTSEPFIVAAGQGPRLYRDTEVVRLTQNGVPGWTAVWDRDTDVPLRLWGTSPVISGANANASIAEAAARRFVREHLATLAPGATVNDFVLVANIARGDTRSVGFAQYANGMRVVGGAIGVTFKRDRIVMTSSTALPNVVAIAPASPLFGRTAAFGAEAWLARDGHPSLATASTTRVILPIVRPRRADGTADILYHVAEQVTAQATTTPDRWEVWVDGTTGAALARRSTIRFATGTIQYNVPDRWPGGTRAARPAENASVTIGASTVNVGANGEVTWSGTGAAMVGLRASGPYASVSGGVTESISLQPGGTIAWSKATSETLDAQLSAFMHVNAVKAFVRTRLDSTLPWLNRALTVSVNETGECNAFSTGDDIHFLRKGGGCENTARLADVVYHEFGHSLHAQALIEGVGEWDSALSEGLGDILAMLMTDDSSMGIGFFSTAEPLRELNPAGRELAWPGDVTGEPHNDGEIIGGTMWDLKVLLEGKLGAEAGKQKSAEIFFGILQRASDIPSSYAEALVADDDDGDVTNGTPNQCEISTAFFRHGLAESMTSIAIDHPTRDGFAIRMNAMPSGDSACAGPSVASAVVDWRVRGGTDARIDLSRAGDAFTGAIPTQPDETVVQYKVTVTLTDGTVVAFPSNAADPYYEFYAGDVEPIWCARFEGGFTDVADWTFGAEPGTDSWEVATPRGLGGDPRTAAAGTGALGLDLTGDGMYSPSTMAFAETPAIDLAGHTKVRLQLSRWLGVEDGFYDQARILVNDTEVWTNFASAQEQGADINHRDAEWRFVDVDLAAYAGSPVKIRFELAADEGLQLGGWTLDDVCVVTPFIAPPGGGDDDGDGDGTTDDGDGTTDDGTTDGDAMGTGDLAGGCCSSSTGAGSSAALSLLAVVGLMRRRRR